MQVLQNLDYLLPRQELRPGLCICRLLRGLHTMQAPMIVRTRLKGTQTAAFYL